MTTDLSTQVAVNIAGVRARIARAAERAGRDPEAVRLVAVTKSTGPAGVRAGYDAGLREFGENRVADAAAKLAELEDLRDSVTWHLVGHLQRNKARDALGLFDIIDSVDSERLAERIDGLASSPVPVLLEVNIAQEPAKHGFDLAEVDESARRIGRRTNLEVRGLMGMAPQVADPSEARPYFRALRQTADRLGLTEISMGMTGDFEVAVEEGATMVRIGRALFAGPGNAAEGGRKAKP